MKHTNKENLVLTNKINSMNEQSREAKARRQLRKLGYQLKKSRVQRIHADNHGGYMITDQSDNVVTGSRYDLTREDVEQFILERT